MAGAERFYELVSGKKRGIVASLLRTGLWLAEWPYRGVVAYRNRQFDRGGRPITQVEVPVISVGNLSVGGTGKTPMVKWLARAAREAGVRVSLVSRGYGAEHEGMNDEALELEQALPDVPHVQNPDRVAAARLAIDELATQLIVLDDAFQHRRIGRDLDIVLLDATQPFGFGHLLPRGTLRESVSGLRRADVVCLTRSDLVDASECEAIRKRVASIAPDAVWCESIHAPSTLTTASGLTMPLDSLKGKRVLAFCGIGNPAAFEQTLRAAGCELLGMRTFPDHHAYDRSDLNELAFEAKTLTADWLVCTQKDLVKVGVDELDGYRVVAVTVEMQFHQGEEELRGKLDELIASIPPDEEIEEASEQLPDA